MSTCLGGDEGWLVCEGDDDEDEVDLARDLSSGSGVASATSKFIYLMTSTAVLLRPFKWYWSTEDSSSSILGLDELTPPFCLLKCKGLLPFTSWCSPLLPLGCPPSRIFIPFIFLVGGGTLKPMICSAAELDWSLCLLGTCSAWSQLYFLHHDFLLLSRWWMTHCLKGVSSYLSGNSSDLPEVTWRMHSPSWSIW